MTEQRIVDMSEEDKLRWLFQHKAGVMVQYRSTNPQSDWYSIQEIGILNLLLSDSTYDRWQLRVKPNTTVTKSAS